jgi:hypothetical protein
LGWPRKSSEAVEAEAGRAAAVIEVATAKRR